MIIATWTMAIATVFLALSVPIAGITLWVQRRDQKQQRQREEHDERDARVAERIRREYGSADQRNTVWLLAIMATIVWTAFSFRKKDGPAAR